MVSLGLRMSTDTQQFQLHRDLMGEKKRDIMNLSLKPPTVDRCPEKLTLELVSGACAYVSGITLFVRR